MKEFNTKNIFTSSTLIVLLLCTCVLVQPALADPPLPNTQNVTIQQAEHMIKTTKNLLILDVRNATEYEYGHLNNAIWIPLHELESRINELTNSKNLPILVYCGVGGRSATACQILSEHGFAKVYNMMGGITDWINADYPIYTVYHHTTVDVSKNRIMLDIMSELAYQTNFGCIPCIENSTNIEATPPDVEINILENTEDHSSSIVTYDDGNTSIECTVNIDLIWKSEEITKQFNRTATLFSTEVVSDELTIQYYTLKDEVFTKTYTMNVMTTLFPLNSGVYNSSAIVVNYTPVEDIGVTSLEIVDFNSAVTLSQAYSCLEETAKEIGNIYQRSNDDSLKELAQGYKEMRKELQYLAQLVKDELPQYDKEILYPSAILTDVCTYECFSNKFLPCANGLGAITLAFAFGCIVTSLACGPFAPACAAACLSVGSSADLAIVASCALYAAGFCCF